MGGGQQNCLSLELIERKRGRKSFDQKRAGGWGGAGGKVGAGRNMISKSRTQPYRYLGERGGGDRRLGSRCGDVSGQEGGERGEKKAGGDAS